MFFLPVVWKSNIFLLEGSHWISLLQINKRQFSNFQLHLFPYFYWSTLNNFGALNFSFIQPFNSHEWPRQNFSLQYQYSVNQTSNENKEKY